MDQSSTINLNSISYRNIASCGYCQGRKSTKLWVTTGFQCSSISPTVFQTLMDRGWRRCGVYYYMPHIYDSCCQAYTIRLDTYNFRQRNSHSKLLRKIRHISLAESTFQQHQQKGDDQIAWMEPNQTIMQLVVPRLQHLPPDFQPYVKEVQLKPVNGQLQLKNIEMPTLQQFVYQQTHEVAQAFCHQLIKHIDQIIHTVGFVNEDKFDLIRARLIEFIHSISTQFKVYESKNCAIAINVVALLYKNMQVFWKSELKVQLPQLSHPEFIDLCQEIIDVQLHNYPLKVCIKKGNQMICDSEKIHKYRTIKQAVFRHVLLIQKNSKPKYQIPEKIQEDIPEELILKKPVSESPIEVRWVKAQFEGESFELYCHYQRTIHGKEYCSKESYISFLCQSAVQESKHVADDGNVLECGCWHMKYYLENTLIAVGVVDVLLQGVSSVYFFYDPQYRKYSLGVFGALKEVEFIKHKQKSFPYLQFYYLGFYIQDSSKMVYKGEYEHSDLLCPITKTWVPLTPDLRKKIDLINESMIQQGHIPDSMKVLNQQATLSEDEQDIETFIKENVTLNVCSKQVMITNLKQKFSMYMLTLFKQLIPLIGRDLVKNFTFKYNRG